jgi:ABC-type antimicrobial peptide transport system permease subunit
MLLFGVVAGAVLAWLSARLVGSFLYGVTAHDGWTLACAAVLLCACGLLAAYIPARRAAMVNPIVALRGIRGVLIHGVGNWPKAARLWF